MIIGRGIQVAQLRREVLGLVGRGRSSRSSARRTDRLASREVQPWPKRVQPAPSFHWGWSSPMPHREPRGSPGRSTFILREASSHGGIRARRGDHGRRAPSCVWPLGSTQRGSRSFRHCRPPRPSRKQPNTISCGSRPLRQPLKPNTLEEDVSNRKQGRQMTEHVHETQENMQKLERRPLLNEDAVRRYVGGVCPVPWLR